MSTAPINQRPIRVLHVLNTMTGKGCGIVNAAVDIISGQVREGLTLAVCSFGGDFLQLLQEQNIPHYFIDQRPKVKSILQAPFVLRRIIKDFRPDVVHCHMMTGVVLTRLLRITQSYGLVAHLHNVHQKSSATMRLADRVIAVSHGVLKDMVARGMSRKKLRVVHNGTLGSLRLPDVATCEPKDLQQPAIVMVGGLNYRKGIAELISAFERICERKPECHLYLVGDGPNRAEFEAQAAASTVSDRIHFEGFTPNPIPYMKAAHTFVLASRRDSFGLVLTEARECGCAIVGTAVDGIPEALDGGEAGLLVPPRNVPALADAILSILDSPEKRAALQARAQENLDQFRVERVAERITEIYREVLRAGHRHRPEGSSAAMANAVPLNQSESRSQGWP
jgi:glycosyltransferase involved in cell wall biosynthesis